MTNSYENSKQGKMKKDIKGYTYVDSDLNSKLQYFMEDNEIKNQAKLIRNFVNYSIDYFKAILKKSHNNPQNYDGVELDNLIKKAIDAYDINSNFQEELRQKLSPLKLSLLVLKDFIEEKQKFSEDIQNALSALEDLESSVKHHFEAPNIIRYVKKIDILYIEDNELERKTVDYFYKTQGLKIKSVETSEEALYILKTLTPRAILLDINLKTSNINGDKLCQMLKSNTQYESIPIILISAVFSEKEKENVLASTGAVDIIFKPIDKLKDLDVIFKYLKH